MIMTTGQNNHHFNKQYSQFDRDLIYSECLAMSRALIKIAICFAFLFPSAQCLVMMVDSYRTKEDVGLSLQKNR